MAAQSSAEALAAEARSFEDASSESTALIRLRRPWQRQSPETTKLKWFGTKNNLNYFDLF